MSGLPPDVEEFLQYLGRKIDGYGYLKWNEVAKVKADMMNVRERWLTVDPGAFRSRCQEVGMTADEVAEMGDYLRRTQAGQRLVPQKSYRAYRFKHDATAVDDSSEGVGPA